MQSFKSFIVESKYNKGDVAEVVLGAAMTVKFMKKDESPVTELEVTNMIRNVMNTSNVVLQRRDKISTEIVYDDITFKAGVPKKAMDFLGGNDLSEIDDLLQSAMAYVNSNRRLNRQAKLLRSNSKVDEIIINSDGVGDQKGTKADIKLTVNGKKTRNQISLKVAGGEQFAQVSGAGFDKQIALWKEGLGLDISNLKSGYNKVMSNFDPELKFKSRSEGPAEEQKKIVKNAMHYVYSEATRELNRLFSSKDPDFVETLIKFITKGISGDERKYIELVKLERGKFKSIRTSSKSFDNMIKSLDLVAEMRKSGDPMIYIKDRNSGNILITIRAKTELASSKTKAGKLYRVYPRNYIEAPSNSLLYSL